MIRAVLLVCVAMGAAVEAQKEAFDHFAYIQTFSKCFGDEVYLNFLAQIQRAKSVCQNTAAAPLILPNRHHAINVITTQLNPPPQVLYGVPNARPHFPNPPTFPTYVQGPIVYNRKKRQSYPGHQSFLGQQGPLFDREDISGMVDTLYFALSNFTCVLQSTGFIDENWNVNVDRSINYYRSSGLDHQLTQDLVEGVTFCNDFSRCLPVERTRNPIPANLQRLLAFMECERKSRLATCYKHTLRQYISLYDVSGLPDDGGRTSDVDKLATVFIGAFSTNDLELI